MCSINKSDKDLYCQKRFLFWINAVLFTFSSMNPEKVSQVPKKKIYILSIKTVSNIDNKWALNHVRMISEGSCDNEDWSKAAENSALHHSNKLDIKVYQNRKQIF